MIRAATKEEIESVLPSLPLTYSEDMRGVRNDGAMVVYDHWTPAAVQVHIYSRGPAYLFKRDFLRAVFGYPFKQCGRRKLVAVTPANATASLAVSRALGFRETYRIKDGWDVGVDMIVKEMTREECRYLRT